jgi:hypothetical protein
VVGRADQAMYDAKKGGKHVAVCRGHQQPHLQNALAILPGLVFPGGNPNQLARTIVSEDFESPYYDQLTFEVQRELARDVVWRVGYVGTQGGNLLQTLDGNPRLPYSTTRVDPSRGVIRNGQLPEPVGHQRRRAHHLDLGKVFVLRTKDNGRRRGAGTALK